MKNSGSLGDFLNSLLSFLMVMLLCVSSAYADVWGYIDAKGVAHFASEKMDDRYELFFKGNTAFDTKEGVVSPSSANSASTLPEPEPPRVVSVPAGKSKLLAFFEVSPNFKAVRHHMREASKLNNLDFELLQALIATESGFDTNAVSPKGAVGLMQLMPPTAQRFGVQADAKTPIEKKLTDPQINIKAGSRYLRELINLFSGKLELALAAYNAGEGAVQRHGNKIPPFKETQNYVATVMQIYRQLKPPSALQNSGLQNAGQSKPEANKLQQPARVTMEFSGKPQGQIPGRGNMVPPLTNSSGALPSTSNTPSNQAANESKEL